MKVKSVSKLVLFFIGISLLVLSAGRCFQLVAHFDRIQSFSDIFYMLTQGVRVDLVLMGYLYSIPLLISVCLNKGKISQYLTYLIKFWLVAVFTVVVFMEVITPEFIAEYDVRPNRLFIDYLKYPAEVSAMLWTGYKGPIALGFASIFIALGLAFKQVKRAPESGTERSIFARIGLSALVIVIGFIVMRSSLQHRPFNPSVVYFSNDNLVNSLVLNSTYSVIYSAYSSQKEKSTEMLYGKMPQDQVISHVRSHMIAEQNAFLSDKYPTLIQRNASFQGKPKNIVILLQESLGSRYVGSLGGKDFTPNLDNLMTEGWKFTNLYATGTRSVRGIEAVIAGFNPTPARAVVKLDRSQTGFFTIASLLKSQGYQTQFIYGGESHFDNMKSFFLGNGFTNIHDLPKFEAPKFVGSWGASDEDLYNEAHKQLTKLHNSGDPFLSLVFTTSNHTPFEYPDGCIKPDESKVKFSQENAIRYSDCALGKFMAQAKKSVYWDNTIFLIVADHDSKAFGTSVVPIEHFEVPALILGKDIIPRVDHRLSSQIDLPPTLLSMAGISANHPMTGSD